MKTIIAGSRNISSYSIVLKAIRKAVEIAKIRPTCVISGGANGVDKLGEAFARDFGFAVEIYEAEWEKYGKRAGYLRNEEMAKAADAAIIIWDGNSKGTKHMIDLAKKHNLKTHVHNIYE